VSNIKDNITELVGNTPLVKLRKIGYGLDANILAKLEFFNPCGSIKDRIGVSMIKNAEQKGLINKDTTIIEATSGNTGIGLAFVCAQRGYKLIITMPDTMSTERSKLLKIFGAEIILTPGKKGMAAAVKKAEKLLKETPNSFMPQQFKNPANPEIHRETTAREIWQDTDGMIDILVSGVGTGGTITGIAEYIKSKKKNFKAIAVEPEDSAVISGGKPGHHKIQGIGAGFIPDILRKDMIDEVITVKSEDAIETTLNLARKEGILCGISSGAAVWVAIELAKKKETRGKMIVVIIPDTGERYLSTLLFQD